MEKHIFIINGSGGKGKDTFVKFCSELIPTYNISSVDKIKEASRILGWDGGKTEEDRLFLADMKYLSSRYNDHPFKYIKSNIEYFKRTDFELMFIHIREPEEIERVKNEFNCRTMLIKNINVKDIKSNKADANVNNYNYDFIINNDNDLNKLKINANNFVKKYI